MLFLLWKAVQTEFTGLYNLHTPPCPNETEQINFQIVFLELILICMCFLRPQKMYFYVPMYETKLWDTKNTVFLQRRTIFELVKIISPTIMPNEWLSTYLGTLHKSVGYEAAMGYSHNSPWVMAERTAPAGPLQTCCNSSGVHHNMHISACR